LDIGGLIVGDAPESASPIQFYQADWQPSQVDREIAQLMDTTARRPK